MKAIEVRNLKGQVVKYLDLIEQKKRYGTFFKDRKVTDSGIIQILDYLSSNQTFQIVDKDNTVR